MTLSEGDDGLTILDYLAVPLIKGRLAAIGQRFIKASADQLSKQFFCPIHPSARRSRRRGQAAALVDPADRYRRRSADRSGRIGSVRVEPLGLIRDGAAVETPIRPAAFPRISRRGMPRYRSIRRRL